MKEYEQATAEPELKETPFKGPLSAGQGGEYSTSSPFCQNLYGV
jgi:hypothetical protein